MMSKDTSDLSPAAHDPCVRSVREARQAQAGEIGVAENGSAVEEIVTECRPSQLICR